MLKKDAIVNISAVCMVFLASNLACRAVLAIDVTKTPDPSEITQDSAVFGPAGDIAREEAQNWMQKAQNWLTEASRKAYESAQEAARQEISRQINKQVKDAENKAVTVAKSTADMIKENIINIFSKIKTFFIILKNKIFNKDRELAPYN